ncbi:MAG: tRNA pseudouridine(55) synthase TruB [Flavobacteriales bacterium]
MQDFAFTPEAGGLLLVDKPLGWTSFDAVSKIRGAMRSVVGRRGFKVGHAGTLDPLASGLIIAYGPRTKELPFLAGLEKTYIGTVTLGSTTPSYDLETAPVRHGPWEQLSEEDIRAAFGRFVGVVEQRPPLYSAKRHKGERGYHLAREGAKVEMPPVAVSIAALRVVAVRGPQVDFEARVGKGTYIRSLAHDIGQALGCGAHLSALRRTAIGSHRVEDALGPAAWAERIAPRLVEGPRAPSERG